MAVAQYRDHEGTTGMVPVATPLPSPWAESRIAVVVPTYNEADNLPILAERVLGLPLPNLRLVIADDNSPDGTGTVADELAATANAEGSDRMVVLHRKAKEGIGRAHIAGMVESMARGADFVVQMDADLSHQPEVIPGMLGTMLSTDAGLVIGSRYVIGGSLSAQWSLHRRLLSRGGSAYVNAIMRLGIRDTTGGFKLWRRDVLEAIDLDRVRSDGFSFQIEMNHRCKQLGRTIVEIPIHFEERFSGTSKISLRIQLEALKLPWQLMFDRR
ncbi:MAG TPA: polyprenol monophosphomannose synthase [Pseudonocardiaceae bacterium]|jgi:dolichol-phosphate mannosyltransferase|nr:polyprenol monophosphomannose synthase [Pseudonocardiaceae bacterium]